MLYIAGPVGKYIANVRQAILKELKAAYHKLEIVEELPTAKIPTFVSLAQDLNGEQRGEGAEKRQ